MSLFAWNRIDAALGWPILWVTVAWCTLTGLSRWSDSLEGTDILPTELLMFRWFRWIRPLGVILTFMQWDRPRQFAIDLAWYVGFYALTVYGPRKPALWRRAVDPLNRIAARVVGVDLRHLSLAPLK